MSLKSFPINTSAAVFRRGLLAQLDKRSGAALRNNDDTLSLCLMWRDRVELGSNLHLWVSDLPHFSEDMLYGLSVVSWISHVAKANDLTQENLEACRAQIEITWKQSNKLDILWCGLEDNKTAVSQIRNLKTTTLTESPTTDVLILAVAEHDLSLWSCMVCCASPYLTSLCLSLWACHFPPLLPPLLLLLLLSFPPWPRRPWQCSLEVALLGGRGGGVYMVGAALLWPHHWLL